ncbi:hypothetical protein QBK99_12620 [Corticibacterium sp. UT-5YL-CI-8]|nr:hypothetical protein [Tianweitania sp. UT-5YL-CI-8]
MQVGSIVFGDNQPSVYRKTQRGFDYSAALAVEGVVTAPSSSTTLHYESATRERGPYIGTYTGRFYPFDPKPNEFEIEDIAHSLAALRRYTGHGTLRYCVAEHSVHIYRWLVAQGADVVTRLCGLLHDAPEALSGYGDVASPSKRLAPIIGETEASIWRKAIAPRFELPMGLPSAVHEADSRIVADEMAQNMGEVDPGYTNPLGITLEYWDEARAKAEFLRAFYDCQRLRQQQRRRVV